MHGMGGLTLLAASLNQLSNWSDAAIDVQENQSQALRFDLKGQSVLSCGGLLADLIIAEALDNGFSIGRIRNAPDPKFIAKQLIDGQSLGLQAVAYWETRTEALESGSVWQMLRTATYEIVADSSLSSNDNRPNENSSNENACTQCPCLEVFDFSQLKSMSENRYELVLIYAKDRRQLDQILEQQQELTHAELLATRSAATNRLSYLQALHEGIEIPSQLWKQLIELGNKVLVESNEQSRKGAGA